MNGEAEPEGARPRPLSGGLWTLFSWLRRDEHSSSDSLSSVGSDHTTVSFAFLAPSPQNRIGTVLLPQVGPPTDTYKKRVYDRNLRRQHDRDLTLHRKYGLFRGDGGYDAFSLPPARRTNIECGNGQERERRATSECYQRCAAHVPGKRRAPLPPIAATTSLARRHTRKRPAPQPPKLIDKIQKNQPHEQYDIRRQMNPKSDRDKRPLSSSDYLSMSGCKSEKYSKKDNNAKDLKPRTEKNFLKQIFENKKRNSAIETSTIKILPSISELDKQAADIIESCKLKPIERNNNRMNNNSSKGDQWYCTRCLRKYDSTIITCLYCLPEQKNLTNGLISDKTILSHASNIYTQTDDNSASNLASTSKVNGMGANERQKLKEMLKEMKNSLPKRQKNEGNNPIDTKPKANLTTESEIENTLETPTLRIGVKLQIEDSVKKPSSSKDNSETVAVKLVNETNNILISPNKTKSERNCENVVTTHPVVLIAPRNDGLSTQKSSNDMRQDRQHMDNLTDDISMSKLTTQSGDKGTKETDKENPYFPNEKVSIHTPLKISSLLNPVYLPKNKISEDQVQRNVFFSQVQMKTPSPKSAVLVTTVSNETSSTSKLLPPLTPQSPLNHLTTAQSNVAKVNSEIGGKSFSKEDTSLKLLGQAEEKPKLKLLTRLESPSPSTALSPLSNIPSKSKSNESNVTKFSAEQHTRRRDLINQLEQSIAKGDEHAAAEAAVKLAQLKLSCSVLSFSSQIVGESSKNNSKLESSKIVVTNQTVENSSKTSNNSSPNMNILSNQPNKKQEKSVSTRDYGPIIKTKKDSLNISKLAKDETTKITINSGPSTSGHLKNDDNKNSLTSIEVWVEDREATRGPVQLRIPRQAVMGDLRRQAEISLGLASRLQRWIVGRTLCTDDSTPLVALAGPSLTAPFYLCVVESETNPENVVVLKTDHLNAKTEENPTPKDKTGDVYSELVQLEKRALVLNTESFECGVCMEDCAIGRGAILRECVHSFCKDCLSDLVRHSEDPAVSCPAMGCRGILQEREIRALVSDEDYERWLARGLTAAESGNRNAFHCRTRDCTGWAFCEPGVRRFPCPVCKRNNCVPCQAIHDGETCEEFRIKLQQATNDANSNQTDEGTQVLLDTLISKGEALQCPECSAIITKKWGCDWVKCSACKTEICWVTRGRRWGPGGRGDTSGGCRCGVDGKRCHPSCGYCH